MAPPKNNVCAICGKRYERKERYLSHMSTHTGEGRFECDICGKKLVYLSSYNDHMKLHTGNIVKRYKCVFCDKMFKTNYNLQSHLKVHTHERPFICKEMDCGQEFSKKVSYDAHMAKGHAPGEVPPASIARCDRGRWVMPTTKIHKVRVFGCEICNKVICGARRFKDHMGWHKAKATLPFKCVFCTKGYPTNDSLENHIRGHLGEKPYFCMVCKKEFTQTSGRNLHYMRHSEEEKIAAKKRRKRMKNFGEKPPKKISNHNNPNHKYKCTLCDMRWETQRKLKDHLLYHEAKDSPKFGCIWCPKKFSKKYLVADHIRWHLGEKPYFCHVCHAEFANKNNRKSHFQRHSDDEKKAAAERFLNGQSSKSQAENIEDFFPEMDENVENEVDIESEFNGVIVANKGNDAEQEIVQDDKSEDGEIVIIPEMVGDGESVKDGESIVFEPEESGENEENNCETETLENTENEITEQNFENVFLENQENFEDESVEDEQVLETDEHFQTNDDTENEANVISNDINLERNENFGTKENLPQSYMPLDQQISYDQGTNFIPETNFEPINYNNPFEQVVHYEPELISEPALNFVHVVNMDNDQQFNYEYNYTPEFPTNPPTYSSVQINPVNCSYVPGYNFVQIENLLPTEAYHHPQTYEPVPNFLHVETIQPQNFQVVNTQPQIFQENGTNFAETNPENEENVEINNFENQTLIKIESDFEVEHGATENVVNFENENSEPNIPVQNDAVEKSKVGTGGQQLAESQPESSNTAEDVDSESEEIWKCAVCHKVCATHDDVVDHLWMEHSVLFRKKGKSTKRRKYTRQASRRTQT